MGTGRVKALVAAVVAVVVVALTAGVTASLAAKARSSLGGGSSRVIVVLRDQNRGLPFRSAARRAAVGSEQAPIIAGLRAGGARGISSTTVLNALTATVSAGQASALARNPAVAEVVPDSLIQAPSPGGFGGPPAPSVHAATQSGATSTASPSICGTADSPELDPEALTHIDAGPSDLPTGIDGSGVTVAYLAGAIDTTNPDLQRNQAYQSQNSQAGSPVLTQVNFSGDPAGTPQGSWGDEAFIDASSIVAQGNQTYDLSQLVNPALPSGCDIKIVGAAPGASVMGLEVGSSVTASPVSNFLQAIDYAVNNGAQVISESFGSNPFPDDAGLDVIRQADDAAIAAGVTVVVSSGDAGINSTIGSPASDPNVISVGASTTFRAYAQAGLYGINLPLANGNWVDNNISALSSGGFTQGGSTVDLVAPGDLNWMLCSPSSYTWNCGGYQPILLDGGTSEAAPLTAGGAADVIQAYAATHGGTDPSPALVKQILSSTATDIGAPATEQGAGLLNVAAAVNEAESLTGTSVTSNGGLLVSPGQINVAQQPGDSTTRTVSVTNTGSSPVTVGLSTRALSKKVGDQTGSFCLQPFTPTTSCPANTGTFQDQFGETDVYQEQTFTVPATSGLSRLEVAADYQPPRGFRQNEMSVALFEPDGTYAGYSLPQGMADYAQVEVANPPAGTWTAVFFTPQGGNGISGTVQWDASTYQYKPAGSITPTSMQLAAGQTGSAKLTLTSPSTAGDSGQSVVLSTAAGQTTVPVTVRTLIPTNGTGGSFSGVLTGGNGRGAPAQTNSYYFNVPAGKRDLTANVTVANDPGEAFTAFLVDPNGQVVGYSANLTNSSGRAVSTRTVSVYHVAPQAGQWSLDLAWYNAVSGNELQEPFSGTIAFNQVSVKNNLPTSATTQLTQGQPYTFQVKVNNTGVAPEEYFVDPRLAQTTSIQLPSQFGSDASNISLPAGYVFYVVPTHTSMLEASVTGSVPVTFDMYDLLGDPVVSPALTGGAVTGSQSGDAASLTLTEPEIAPGMWGLATSEIGPYPDSGAPTATASATVTATTAAFDPAVTSDSGDLWSSVNGLSSGFSPAYAAKGASTVINVTITPTAAPGTTVSGTLYVDDDVAADWAGNIDGDELAAIPYLYTVK